MCLWAASRPVNILPLSSRRSPGFQLATLARQLVDVDGGRRRRRPVHVGPARKIGGSRDGARPVKG
jgi:hypothetical protein